MHSFTTVNGNKVIEPFTASGYQVLEIAAPYYWAVYCPDRLNIVTFVEGDLYLTSCDNEEEFERFLDKTAECFN